MWLHCRWGVRVWAGCEVKLGQDCTLLAHCSWLSVAVTGIVRLRGSVSSDWHAFPDPAGRLGSATALTSTACNFACYLQPFACTAQMTAAVALQVHVVAWPRHGASRAVSWGRQPAAQRFVARWGGMQLPVGWVCRICSTLNGLPVTGSCASRGVRMCVCPACRHAGAHRRHAHVV